MRTARRLEREGLRQKKTNRGFRGSTRISMIPAGACPGRTIFEHFCKYLKAKEKISLIKLQIVIH